MKRISAVRTGTLPNNAPPGLSYHSRIVTHSLRCGLQLYRQLRRLVDISVRPSSVASTNFKYTPGFTFNADGIIVNDWEDRIAWQDATGYGTTEGNLRQRLMVDYVYIKDPNVGFQTILDSLSDRHVLLALCAEMVGLNQNNKSG